jgi:hypothetical protein
MIGCDLLRPGARMNGPQDLGGRHGFGAVIPEDESIRFHAEWEKRVLGVTLAAAALGYWNIDASRHARESLPPAIYYNASYYEIWLRGLEILLERAGEVSAEELRAGAGRQRAGYPAGRQVPEAGRSCGRSGEGRPDRTPRPRAPVPRGRPRPHPQPPAEGSHAPARLRTRPCRRGHAAATEAMSTPTRTRISKASGHARCIPSGSMRWSCSARTPTRPFPSASTHGSPTLNNA